ncbi:MAG: flippase [Bacteroidota bacterium]
MSTSIRQFGQNTFWVFLRFVGKLLTGLIAAIVIARILGPEGNGYYSLAVLLPQFLGNFMNLGWSASIVYHISSQKTSFSQGFYASIVGWLVSCIPGMLIGWAVIEFGHNQFFPGIPVELLYISLAAFPFILLMDFTGRLFQGIESYAPFNLVMILNSVVMLGGLGVLFVLNLMTVANVLWAYLGGFLVAGSVGLVAALRLLDEAPRWDKLGSLLRSIWGYGGKAHASNVITFFNYRIDMLLINFFMAAAPTGIYAVAVQIGERLWLFAQAASSVLFPRISALQDTGEESHQLTALISRATGWITLLAAILLGILIVPIIQILFGVAYIDAALVLILLLPGIVAGSFSKILANDFAGRGKPEYNLVIVIIMLIMNIGCNIWLIPIWGINGAAVATTITYLGQFLATTIWYRKRYQVPVRQLLLPQGTDFHKMKSLYRQWVSS